MSIEKPKIESEPNEKEVFTSIQRVLGRKYEDISEEERQEVFKNMEEIFKDQKAFRDILIKAYGSRENIPNEYVKTIFYERSKTLEESKIINLANDKTNELRKKFGLPIINIPSENIYIIPKEEYWPNLKKEANAYNLPMFQFIVIRDQVEQKNIKNSSKLIFLCHIIHEMIHIKYFSSLKKLENFDTYNTHKIGLKSGKREDDSDLLLDNLDEAVTEELTIRLLKELEDHPLFREELERTKILKKYFSGRKTESGAPFFIEDEVYYMNVDTDPENQELYSGIYGSSEERKILNILIDKIYQKNSDSFESREEVFNMFVRAAMTGSLRLGRLINKTFGNGTYRKIAETDNNIKELEEFINNLQ